MADINTVYSGLDKCRKSDCDDCVLFNASKAPWDCPAKDKLIDDALELLKAQKDRHRLEVHNIGNVDIPEGVSSEHFHLVMNNVVDALQHTDKGESWPYHDVT